MKSKLFLVLAFFSGTLFINQNASADGMYWGGGVGTASWDLKPLNGIFELEDGTAINLFWGTRLQNFGGEMSFAFSSHDWKGSGGQATHNAGNLILAGLGYLPLSQTADVYGKIGVNLWHTTVDFLGAKYDGDDGVGIAAGFGLNVLVSPNLALRLQYDYLPGLGDRLDEGDVTMMTVNLAYYYL